MLLLVSDFHFLMKLTTKSIEYLKAAMFPALYEFSLAKCFVDPVVIGFFLCDFLTPSMINFGGVTSLVGV